jgi:signal transduction histidine kinase
MRNSRNLRWYFALFDFVARVRVARNDLDTRVIHSHLTMVITTAVLMWSYAILAYNAFSTPIPGIVGICASLVHLFSPLLFLVTANGSIVCSIALAAGMAHQMTFAYFTGGFDSCIIQWLPILPLLAGFIMGRACLILWSIISTMGIAAYFLLHLNGYDFPFLITETGYHWAQSLLLFGWIFILFFTTWVHVSMKEHSEETLRSQGKKIDDLFRVLFHDLANSLGRINIGMSLAEREENAPSTERGLQVIRDAQESMTEITQNVRRMYAVSKGMTEVDLSPCSLNASMSHVLSMFSQDMEKKKIRFSYDFEKHKDVNIIVEPVSFNNQVLGNIISNAIKFSDDGGSISVRCWPSGPQMVTVEVRDTGIGMPDVLVKSLFDMNKRTSRPGTKGETGTGFGMHIMRSFVEMYKGQVVVESVDRDHSPDACGTCIRLLLRGYFGGQ